VIPQLSQACGNFPRTVKKSPARHRGRDRRGTVVPVNSVREQQVTRNNSRLQRASARREDRRQRQQAAHSSCCATRAPMSIGRASVQRGPSAYACRLEHCVPPLAETRHVASWKVIPHPGDRSSSRTLAAGRTIPFLSGDDAGLESRLAEKLRRASAHRRHKLVSPMACPIRRRTGDCKSIVGCNSRRRPATTAVRGRIPEVRCLFQPIRRHTQSPSTNCTYSIADRAEQLAETSIARAGRRERQRHIEPHDVRARRLACSTLPSVERNPRRHGPVRATIDARQRTRRSFSLRRWRPRRCVSRSGLRGCGFRNDARGIPTATQPPARPAGHGFAPMVASAPTETAPGFWRRRRRSREGQAEERRAAGPASCFPG